MKGIWFVLLLIVFLHGEHLDSSYLSIVSTLTSNPVVTTSSNDTTEKSVTFSFEFSSTCTLRPYIIRMDSVLLHFKSRKCGISRSDNEKNRKYLILLQPYASQCEEFTDDFLNNFSPSTLTIVPLNSTHLWMCAPTAIESLNADGLYRLCASSQMSLQSKRFPLDLGAAYLSGANLEPTPFSSSPVVGVCVFLKSKLCRLFIDEPFVTHYTVVSTYVLLCDSSSVLKWKYSGIPCLSSIPHTTCSMETTRWICDVPLRLLEPRSYAVYLFQTFLQHTSTVHYAGFLHVIAASSVQHRLSNHLNTPKLISGSSHPILLSRAHSIKGSTHEPLLVFRSFERSNFFYPLALDNKQFYENVESSLQPSVLGALRKGRRLQEDFESLPPIVSEPFQERTPPNKTSRQRCTENKACFSGYGICTNNTCGGFIPDLYDEINTQCVMGYLCKIKEGQLQGAKVSEEFQVIAIDMQSSCGMDDPIPSTKSIFGNSNRWQCEKGYEDSCVFVAGVGYKLNTSETVEKVRLCGCPGVDKSTRGKKCHNRKDFFVPLGTVSVQECLRNAHCVDLGLASCDNGHCVRGAAIAATAGLKVLQCLTSQNCRLKDLGTQVMAESMKLIPITSSHNCGAKRALDPDALSDNALPCVVKLSSEGRCEVNLGLKSFGSSRLCGCLGDPGGNGRNCDQIEDFTDEMAIVDVGECSTDEDCAQKYTVCINQECQVDRLQPTVVDSIPANGSYAVPPIHDITLIWSESIQFVEGNRKVIILNMNPNLNLSWEVEIRDPSTYAVAETGYKVEILQGNKLHIIPDISMSTFPEGSYLVAYASGIVSDMAQNYNMGALNIQFTVSKDAGCPFLGVTGFSTTLVNPNGIYFSMQPINGHAAWIHVRSQEKLYIYWHIENETPQFQSSWVISSKMDRRKIIAYSNNTLQENKRDLSTLRPQGPHWMKLQMNQFTDLYDVNFFCTSVEDMTFPVLVDVDPKNGSVSVPVRNFRFRLTFSEPVTYGHWSNLTITSGKQTLTIFPDVESGFRGRAVKTFMNETVVIDLSDFPDLLPGTIYNVSATVGFVTDLMYNYWNEGGVIFTFTTYGVGCGPFPDLEEAYLVEGPGTSNNGDRYSVSCNAGFHATQNITIHERKPISVADDEGFDADVESSMTPQESAVQQVSCIDGAWEPIMINCKADCNTYHDLSPAYRVPSEHIKSQLTYRHGTSLPVECSKKSVTILDEGNASVVCDNGMWNVRSLVCQGDCGPFPSLNSFYTVLLDETLSPAVASGTLVGARRIVRCAPPSVPTTFMDTVEVICGEQGWGPIELECHVKCPLHDLNLPEGYILSIQSETPHPYWTTPVSSYVEHGKTQRIECSKGYTGQLMNSRHNERSVGHNISHTTVQCLDGKWKWNQHLDCFKPCGKLDLGSGYKITPETGEEGVHGSTYRVECSHLAKTELRQAQVHHISTSQGPPIAVEIVQCLNGVWTSPSLICRAPCEHPENALGSKSYTAVVQGDLTDLRFNWFNQTYESTVLPHGTIASLVCSSTSEIIQGTSPEDILCYDGQWISYKSLEDADVSITDIASTKFTQPKLICQTRCGPRLKDFSRYTYSGDLHFLEELIQRPLPEGSISHIHCKKGYSPSDPLHHLEGTLICRDGEWIETEPFLCLESCTKPSFSVLFQRGYDLVDPTVVAVTHSQKVYLTCRQNLLLRISPKSLNATIFEAKCFNGKFILPLEKCGPATCEDGIQNGEEKGIDCGSGDCPSQFSKCVEERQQQSDFSDNPELHCHDQRRNNDEEGINCSGISCERCSVCLGLPSQLNKGMTWTIDGGKNLHHIQDLSDFSDHTSVEFTQGTLLYTMCSPGVDQISTPPALGYQMFRCVVNPATHSAEWVLESAQQFVLKCAIPTCNDARRNGDEEDVDCGGSCSIPCPTCQDGIKNGDEEDVDCGGSRCLACRSCSLAPFKHLAPSSIEFRVLQPDRTVLEENQLSDQRLAKHKSRYRVTCKEHKKEFLILRCRDGSWVPEHTPKGTYDSNTHHLHQDIRMSLQQLSCYPSSLQIKYLLSQSIQTPMTLLKQRFLTASLPESFFCSPHNGTASSASIMGCCDMVRQFNSVMSNECGALLFGGRNSQIRAFCTGSCMKRLRQFLESSATGHTCPKKGLLQEMIQLFCSTNSSTNRLEIQQHQASAPLSLPPDTIYCFASAKMALEQIKKLQDVKKSLLEEACQSQSCVRVVFRYLEILAMMLSPKQDLTHSFMSRHLQENFPRASPTFIYQTAYETTYAFKEWFPKQHLFWNRIDFFRNRQVFSRFPHWQRFLGETTLSIPFANPLTAFTHEALSEKLLNFLCLKDSKGNSCVSIVKSILSNDETEISRSLELLDLKSSDSCSSSKCFWQVIRHLGQSLYSQGLRSVDSYFTFLGILLRTYARVSCQKSLETRESCALSLGFNITRLTLDRPLRQHSSTLKFLYDPNEDHTHFNDESATSCKCSAAFLGDGFCDPECFNPLCDFDHGDCSFKALFPSVYQELNAMLSAENACHPFSPRFYCSRKPHGCYSLIMNVVKAQGCCAATRWSLLRELLIAEKHLQYIASFKRKSVFHFKAVEMSTYDTRFQSNPTSSAASQSLVLDRSTAFIETACQISLNPSCAADPNQRQSVSQLIFILREKIANFLALSRYDITEIRFWPWDIQVEVVIDPGVLYAEVNEDLKKANQEHELEKVLTSAIQEFILFVQDTDPEMLSTLTFFEKNTTHHSRHRSLQFPDFTLYNNYISDIGVRTVPVKDATTLHKPFREIPYSGTLDMNSLEDRLVAVGCTLIPNLSYPGGFDNHVSNPLDNPYKIEFDDPMLTQNLQSQNMVPNRTILRVQCNLGYNVTFPSTANSPQTLVCDRGRWVTTSSEEKLLVCRRPCAPYELWDSSFDPLSLSLTALGDTRDGSSRIVQCARGFVPLEGAQSPEILVCRHGVWDRRSLDCTRDDNLRHAAFLQKAVCGSTHLAQVLIPSEIYVVREVLPKQILLVNQISQHYSSSSSSSENLLVQAQLWTVACTRGYLPNVSFSPSFLIACVNETLLAAPPSISQEWATRLPSEDILVTFPVESNIELYQKVCLDLYSIYQQSQTQHAPSHPLPLQRLSATQPLQLLTCLADIKASSWKATSPSRMSDALFYGILLLGSFLFIVTVILVVYFKRTHCMKRPFFDPILNPQSSQSIHPQQKIQKNPDEKIATQIEELQTRETELSHAKSSESMMTPSESSSSSCDLTFPPQNRLTSRQIDVVFDDSSDPHLNKNHLLPLQPGSCYPCHPPLLPCTSVSSSQDSPNLVDHDVSQHDNKFYFSGDAVPPQSLSKYHVSDMASRKSLSHTVPEIPIHEIRYHRYPPTLSLSKKRQLNKNIRNNPPSVPLHDLNARCSHSYDAIQNESHGPIVYRRHHPTNVSPSHQCSDSHTVFYSMNDESNLSQ